MNKDPKVFKLIAQEEKRQLETLQMIPSENHASRAVREASGSVLTNKYSEGYPGRRYYQGNRIIDEVENLAIARAKKLFKVPHANVQPYSGSPGNSAVLFALCEMGDTIMGLKLAAGGHLTHGQPKITFSGKYFRPVQFGLDENGLLSYEEIAELARREKPKVMIIGTTAYPLAFDWKKFGQIADSIGAYLIADVAHVSGLIIGRAYPDPVPYAHVVTTTTHKTLRGPRGAMIMVTEKGIKKDKELPDKIDKAVFPGLQGGPHDNTTAAIAQAFFEASQPAFKRYAKQVVKNAKALARELKKGGLTLVGGGTECHLLLVDLRPLALSGNVVAEALEEAGIVCNRNSVPNDSMPPFYPSGIRLGTPALTTRGMKEREIKKIAGWIVQVIDHVKKEELPVNPKKRTEFLRHFREKIKRDIFFKKIAQEVKVLARRFPTP
ncbi:MAG: serine hydroxymethyltransferase [Candidatus Blackburnbacteria bacterium]|nr:serine hydroxymethyltransferase [Candidatus Blackburnbacteria bacterium]